MITIDLSRCTGCRVCETTCAFYHSGVVSRHRARIKVVNLYEIGVDAPVVCQQCPQRYCLQCPAKAISIGSFGQVIVSPTLCTACGACERRCPLGAIELFAEIPYVCDLCGGTPRCVAACTEGAITFDAGLQVGASLCQREAETKGLNPGEKRALHVRCASTGLRKKWGK